MGAALMDLGYSREHHRRGPDSGGLCSCWRMPRSKGVYQAFVMDQVFDKMEGGNAAIAMYYAGDYLTMLENNPDLELSWCRRRAPTGLWTPCVC